ncbi:MAG TPA: hypothetical protein VG387_00150 [Rhizomicrobium sp.]|jgi:hypothetical protein|nr:hypothetical protein [Rhizomicrobium sp.]
MRFILILAAAFLIAMPAFAADKPAKAGDPGTNVEMPFLIAPMTKDDRLLGYSYISSRLVASSQSAALEIRDKIAFIQDAFVRDVNGAPVSLAGDPTAVDVKLLSARLVADAKKVVGATKVVRITFGDGDKDTGIQFSPLHPNVAPPGAPNSASQAAESPVPANAAPAAAPAK